MQYYAKPEVMIQVPPTCFMPKPSVGSTVIKLTRYERPPVEADDENFMFSLIRASFNQRRKTLVNGLTNATNLKTGKADVLKALEEMKLPSAIRGEALTLAQFARLSNLLSR